MQEHSESRGKQWACAFTYALLTYILCLYVYSQCHCLLSFLHVPALTDAQSNPALCEHVLTCTLPHSVHYKNLTSTGHCPTLLSACTCTHSALPTSALCKYLQSHSNVHLCTLHVPALTHPLPPIISACACTHMTTEQLCSIKEHSPHFNCPQTRCMYLHSQVHCASLFIACTCTHMTTEKHCSIHEHSSHANCPQTPLHVPAFTVTLPKSILCIYLHSQAHYLPLFSACTCPHSYSPPFCNESSCLQITVGHKKGAGEGRGRGGEGESCVG